MRHVTCTQGIIYPVSHRSLRIDFGALRNNCESQSEKLRIEKIKRETVQPCIANGDRSRLPAIMHNPAVPAPCRLKHVACMLMTVDQNVINRQRA